MSKAAVGVVKRRRWEALNPEILGLIFLRIQPVEEMVRCVPFVCKPWMEVVAGPYCWRDINLLPWSRLLYDDDDVSDVDLVVEKLVRLSSYMVQRLSVNRMGESGFLSVVSCGISLKMLEIPRSSITDDMVLKHIKPLPNLVSLDISHCVHITHKGIAAFGNHCKSLIDFKRCMSQLISSYRRPIDESEAKTIAHTMPNLQRIQLHHGKFSNSGVLEILTKCKSLTHLDIEGCCKVVLDDHLLKICGRLENFQFPRMNDDYDDDDYVQYAGLDFEESYDFDVPSD